MSDVAIRVENLSKLYRIGQRERYKTLRDSLTDAMYAPLRGLSSFVRRSSSSGANQGTANEGWIWALKDVSFEVKHGEVIGIIGRNGAGKSTMLKILSRITEPTEGYAEIHGRVGSLLEVGTGFHPELTGRENIYLNGAVLGMKRREIERKFEEIVAFAEIEKFLDTPVKHYSSGMYLRLAFAVAAHLEPEVLLVDEVLAVGDIQFQKKCLGKMQDVAGEGRTVIFVSHNMQTIRQMCQEAILIDRGHVAFEGPPSKAIMQYFGSADHTSLLDPEMYRRSTTTVAYVRTIQFRNDRNETKHQFLRGEQLHILLNFSTVKYLSSFDIAMAIVHGDGTTVFSETLSDRQQPHSLAPGNYELDLGIDLGYFKLEPYFLAVYLLEKGRVLDHVDGIPLPEIHDPVVDTFKEAHRWGVLRIPVQWSLIKGEGCE